MDLKINLIQAPACDQSYPLRDNYLLVPILAFSFAICLRFTNPRLDILNLLIGICAVMSRLDAAKSSFRS